MTAGGFDVAAAAALDHLRARRPHLGLGLAALGRPAYLTGGRETDLPPNRTVEAMAARTAEVLDAATAAGVTYLDVARSYGLAERFLAEWLADRPGPVPFVASKWGYRYTGGWSLDAAVHEVKDHSLSAFREQYEESHRLLGRWLRLYQVHSLTRDSPVFEDAALLRALAEVRDQGMALGASVSGPTQAATIRRALDIRIGGRQLFSAVQATWNLFETSAEMALREAAQAGILVVVKETLANGRLAGESAPQPLRALAAEHAVGADTVATAAALSRPWADVVLSGAVTSAQVLSHLRAFELVDRMPRLPEELAALVEHPEQYWRQRAARAWR